MILKKISVALLGFGTVGKGVYENLTKHQKRIKERHGVEVEVAAIVVKHPEKHQHFAKQSLITTDFQKVLDNPEIEVIFEAIVGREPSFTYLTQSIHARKHVITANKEMFAHHGKELIELAKKRHVEVGFEATTAGGIPIINSIKHLFQVNEINSIKAILNGTSNYILSEMRINELSFTEALKEAQELGYAEADPTNDVEGYDAFYKLMILCQLIYNEQPNWDDVYREGITTITQEDINRNKLVQARFKHIASLDFKAGHILASVKPEVVSADHPLYSIEGVENAIVLEGDIVGKVTLTGPGAGSFPTASAMLEDLSIILQSYLGTSVNPILA